MQTTPWLPRSQVAPHHPDGASSNCPALFESICSSPGRKNSSQVSCESAYSSIMACNGSPSGAYSCRGQSIGPASCLLVVLSFQRGVTSKTGHPRGRPVFSLTYKMQSLITHYILISTLMEAFHLEVKHESHISRESSLIIDDISMAVILVRTTAPSLLQVFTAVRVRSRLSPAPVFSEVNPFSVPAIVCRIGRIGSGEVAILYSLFRIKSCTVIA